MPPDREPDSAPRFQLTPVTMLLGLLTVALAGWTLVATVVSSRDRQSEVSSLFRSEDAVTNVFAAQREALSLVGNTYRWVSGNASRRDVQINRATLANRLNINGIRGDNPVGDDAEFTAALTAWDSAFSTAPRGVLPPDQRVAWNARIGPAAEALATQSRQIVGRATSLIHRDLRVNAASAAESARRLAILLISTLAMAALTLALISLRVRRNYRRAQTVIATETEHLRELRGALERANELERGQTEVLESIATGASLGLVFGEVVVLISEYTRGRDVRLLYGDHVVSTGAPVGTPNWTINFAGAEQGRGDGVLEIYGSEDLTSAEQLVCQRGADLASLAVDREKSSVALLHQANHDGLTGFPNRPFLLAKMEDALSRGRSVAVLFCDLDRFKIVNDSLGHKAGDRLLVEASQRLASTIRGRDVIARLGGDEFVVLCDGLTERNHAYEVARRINEVLAEPFHIDGAEVFISSSIGISFTRSDGKSTASALLREADMAMYRAKEFGRARWVEFDKEMEEDYASRLERETSLRRAIDRGELQMHLQPVVDMNTDAILGFEALLRWNRPGLGPTHPSDFIPLAEENGNIVAIGRWVLAEAIRVLAEWRREGIADGVTVAVNVSGRQLLDASFADDVIALLTSNGLDPRALTLELTESTLIEAAPAHQKLSRLRALGVRIALDDFGTGYSSLTQLRSLPVDLLKLDRSFVNPLASDGPRHREFIAAVVRLGGAMNLDLVVEGVETEAERNELIALGCVRGQGYLFGRPEPVEVAHVQLSGPMNTDMPKPWADGRGLGRV